MFAKKEGRENKKANEVESVTTSRKATRPIANIEMNSMTFCGSRLFWNPTPVLDFQPIFIAA